MNDKEKQTQEALQALSDIGQEMEKAKEKYEAENDTWWNNLSEKEREDAFYAVCKRIWLGDIKYNGTYRYVLYDIFGFDPGMYGAGMDCGYMAIHNAIFDGEEYQKMSGIDRLEVIDEEGRSYVKYIDKDQRVRYNLQDDNKTLKIFVDDIKRVKLEDL